MSRTTRRAARQARQAPARAQAGAPRHTVFAIHAAGAPAWPALTWAGCAIAALYAAAVLVMTFGPHRVGDIFTETDFYGSYGPGARLLEQGHMDPTRYAVVGPVFAARPAAAESNPSFTFTAPRCPRGSTSPASAPRG